MVIREFRPEDAEQVTGCIKQLQNYERNIDARVLPGEAVEGWYLDYLLKACADQDGAHSSRRLEGHSPGKSCKG